jgi:DNA-binding NtrC family response regulator
MMTRSVLIIDDEPNMRWVLGKALEQAGYTVHGAASGDEGLAALGRTPVDLVLLDLKLKGEDGLTVLRRLRERRPELVVMLLTAYGTVANAVEAMQLGAADFLRKPFDVEEVIFKVARALERRVMQQELSRLAAAQRTPPAFEALIGASTAWQRLLGQARLAAQSDNHVLLVGEQGSGRATLAWAIHGASARVAAPFVTFDARVYQLSTQPAALVGTRETGGAWGAAGSGTLLVCGIEEATELGAILASTLAETPQHICPRVIVATAEEASLPIELRNRLALQLRIPPLRERKGDIPLLARHFAGGKSVTASALQLLQQYPWPENVAELRAVVVGAVELAGDGPIEREHLPDELRDGNTGGPAMVLRLPPQGISLEEVERSLIRQALAQACGNKSKAAELLGLTRHTLLYRMEKYEITVPEQP